MDISSTITHPFFISHNMSRLWIYHKGWKGCGEMAYIFFGFLAVCVLAMVGMFFAFCYKHDKLKASFRNETTMKQDEISSRLAVDIDKDNKKETNQ